MESVPADPSLGLPGGVTVSREQSSRSMYAETAVWLSTAEQFANSGFTSGLKSIEPILGSANDIGTVAGSLDSLFSAFRTWAQAPADFDARQAVVQRAADTAAAFNATSAEFHWAREAIETEVQSRLESVNSLVSTIREFNQGVITGTLGAVSEATAFAALEQLSEQVGITAVQQSGGSISVFLGGQSPLLVGSQQTSLVFSRYSADGSTVSNATQPVRITLEGGLDVTAQLSAGRISGLLEAHSAMSTFVGDTTRTGTLNILAQQVAQRVNGILESGVVSMADVPPVPGRAMFAFDGVSPTGVAGTLRVNEGFRAADLAAVDPRPPANTAGVALRLARLADSVAAEDSIDGLTIAQYALDGPARMAGRIKAANDLAVPLTSRREAAYTLRSELSGVSVEQEAVTLLALQRGYEASARVIRAIDEMIQTAISLGA
jgi:flagellar hook-associated protein 1 FlgK